MKDILFLGLGHIGKIFAQQYKDKFNIVSTYDSTSKKINNISEYQFSLGDDIPSELLGEFSTAIFSFPPRDLYMNFLKEFMPQSKADHFVFISSISVYGNGIIREGDLKKGTSHNARILIELEDYIQKYKRISIVRPGGLIDDERHPSKFLKDKELLLNSEGYLNLVHSKDLVGFLNFLVENRILGEFNLVSSTPINRGKLYQKYFPKIKKDGKKEERIILNEKAKNLGFKFEHDDLKVYLNLYKNV